MQIKKTSVYAIPDLKVDACYWLIETDKCIYFDSKELLTYKKKDSYYDSLELIEFNKKFVTIFKNKLDTVFMYDISAVFYFIKDTAKFSSTDTITSDIFNNLLCGLLIDKRAKIVSKDNSSTLLLKTRRRLFCFKHQSVFDPDNQKESIADREVWRSGSSCFCGF